MLIKMSTEAERSYEELQEKINSVHGLLKALAEYLLSRDDSKVMKGMKMMAGEKGDKEDGRKDKEKTKRDEGRKEA